MRPEAIIPTFDAFLADRGLAFEAVIIEGSALALLGVISRQTRNCDVMDPPIPAVIAAAARALAGEMRAHGKRLDDDWFNDKPGSLKDNLPQGWQSRLQHAYQGRALTLKTLGRLDLLRSKLFAFCDRLTDLGDCLALAPTNEELEEVLGWLEQQDGNPTWPDHVRAALGELQRELATLRDRDGMR